MKLVLFIVMMWCCITATGQRTIKQQIHVIQDKYHVHFVYDAKLNLDIQSSKELANNETLKEALKILFDGSNISYKIRGRNILLRSEKRAPDMRQSRRMSIVESLTNVLVGIGVAYLTNVIVFPWFDIHADTRTHISITSYRF